MGSKSNYQKQNGFMIEEMNKGFNNFIWDRDQENEEETVSVQRIWTLRKRVTLIFLNNPNLIKL